MSIRTEYALADEENTTAGHDRHIGLTNAAADIRLLSVAKFCRRYGIGRTIAYAEMADGELPYYKIRGRRLIGVDDAELWVASKRKLGK